MPRAAKDTDRQLVEEIIALTRSTGMRMRRRMAGSSLAMGPSFCLAALSKAGEIPASRLASEVGVRGPTMTGLLDTLEREQLVRRRPSPDDRRVTLLSMTPKGRRLFEKVQDAVIDDWRAALAGVPASTKREWAVAVRALRTLAQTGFPAVGDA